MSCQKRVSLVGMRMSVRAVRAGFRLEGGLFIDHLAAEADDHGIQYVIGEVAHPRRSDLQPDVAVAEVISNSCEGRGIAGEAVTRVLEYAFDTLGMKRVQAVTDERNAAARRMLERLGFEPDGAPIKARYKGEDVTEIRYARSRP